MCGIAGYIGSRVIPETKIRDCLAGLHQRGPDFATYERFDAPGGIRIYLLHTRLGIIDLDERANQPLHDGEWSLICNGELYNYRELRAELKMDGECFHTQSDIEVLLKLLRREGGTALSRCEGMWAFAAYNADTAEVLLSRDRFAEKPLYIYRAPHGWYFASEIKALSILAGRRFKINRRQILRYLVNGYKSLYKQNETFYEEVSEIPFASNVRIGCDLAPRVERYWTPRHDPQDMSMDQAISCFREAFLRSVSLRLRADVPLAFCLSGGVDSAAIVSTAAKCFGYDVATFSIVDSDQRYNERDNIEATIRDIGCRHTIIETSRDNFLPRLTELIKYHDGPLATISYYIHSFLSESISRQGYRVVCSGTGADEMVTGYYDHFNLYLHAMRHSPDFKRYLKEWEEGMGKYVRNPYLRNPRLYIEDPAFRDHIYLDRKVFADFLREPFDEPFREEQYCEDLLHNRMLNELFHEGTRVILHEDDMNSMMHSIENRSPYLDSNLFDVAYSIPTEHLIQQGTGKHVLREAMKGILNDQVRLDIRKKGFNASILSLVDFNDPQTRSFVLSDSPVFEVVDRNKFAPLLDRRPVPNSVSKFLFNFLNVKIFMEQAES